MKLGREVMPLKARHARSYILNPLHLNAQTGSGTHQAYYSNRSEGSLPEDKTAGAWSWPLNSINAEEQNTWNFTSTPIYTMMGAMVSNRDITFALRNYTNMATVRTSEVEATI